MLDRPIFGAVALVSVANNHVAWLRALGTLFGGGSGGDWLFQWFAAILEAEDSQKFVAELEKDSLHRRALEWVKEDFEK